MSDSRMLCQFQRRDKSKLVLQREKIKLAKSMHTKSRWPEGERILMTWMVFEQAIARELLQFP